MKRAEKASQLKRAIISGIVFGVFMGVFYTFQDGAKAGFICGTVAGAVFGIFMYFFANSKIVKRQTELDGDMDGVLYSGAANHFINKEGVGGKLYLLNDRLHFKSHLFNIQNHELEIPIDAIVEVDFYNTLGLVPNGLSITGHHGVQQKFVVNDRKVWKQEILKLTGELA